MVTTGEQAVKNGLKMGRGAEQTVILREYRPADLEALAALFYETIHTTNARDYTPEQLNAWATGEIDREGWGRSLAAHETLVAEADGRIAGFGDMDDTGYLDRLYVHPAFQRQGIAAAICGALEDGARARGLPAAKTHASITARPFFEGRGYAVVREQQVPRGGVTLTNFVMRKALL